MMIKKIGCCIIALFSLEFFAQEQLNNEFKSIVSLSTFAPTISQAPRWTIGYIRKLNERYWIGFDLGYGDDKISINFAEEGGWITDNYKLYEIRPEIYYDLKPKSKLKHLISAELFYINQSDKFKNSWYHHINEGTYYEYDFADYKRIKYGMNINYNLIYYFGKKIALMQKVGVGFRNKNVKYSNLINKTVSHEYDDSDGFLFSNNGFLRNHESHTGFNFNIDFKLMYKF